MSSSPLIQDDLKRKYIANEQDHAQQSGPNQKIPKFSELEANNNTENIENNSIVINHNTSEVNNNENTNDIDDFELYNDDEKPNPASPALRKAQNRAAQRAFRERKERHLHELENTIKLLRDDQYQANILINHLQQENSYFKKLSLVFECTLNNIHGNGIATDEIKKAISTNPDYSFDKAITTTTTPGESLLTSSLSTSDINNGQQQHISLSLSLDVSQRPLPLLNINSNNNNKTNLINKSIKPEITKLTNNMKNGSSEMIPRTNTSIILSPDSFGNLCSTTTTNSCLLPQDYLTTTATNDHMVIPDYNKSFINIPPQINNNDNVNNNDAFLNFNVNDTNNSILVNDSNNSSIKKQQLLRLAEKVGAKDLTTPIIPKLKHPLSKEQIRYLNMEHDSRIDMIPCLHLRSRMIQHSTKYDLYELCEILINKAKCHGDPLDTDSWELPDEIFQKYSYLTFKKCQIKSLLYKRDGAIPKDFNALFENGM
ncbi:11304_t:CDS:2 [Entrophospora sp. SA101]|nr:11304_t:CDS:2 [Entrophospora sp. SA101]